LPSDRIEALKIAHDRGIYTWVVLEPCHDPEQSLQLIRQTAGFVDFYFVEKLNHFPDIEKGIDWSAYLAEAKDLLESLNKDFSVDWRLEKAARLSSR
jgi:hypothetical protein